MKSAKALIRTNRFATKLRERQDGKMDRAMNLSAEQKMNAEQLRLLQRNIAGSMWLRFFYVFAIVMPLIVPIFQSKGLDMQGIFALQTIFATAMLVSEVPSGYLADVFGRRNIILAGAIVSGLSHRQLIFADSFAALVVYEFTLGIGASLLSGADLALLYDTELALNSGQ